MQHAFFASNSCRTCRQKRVKCDRRLPGCLRCSSLKLRCQGYERPRKLVWTNSVASRGKMMGRATFSASQSPDEPSREDTIRHVPESETSNPAGVLAESGSSSTTVSWSLVDPELQDLSMQCRKYIRYFDLDLSRECVVYNQPSTNPFLALMPLMSRSRALSHAMISISAFHYTHRMVISHAQPLAGETGAAQSESREPWHLSQNRHWQTSQPRFRESLRTALSYKQTALEHLQHEVWDDPERNSDAVVAAIVLFICMDVVEYGSHGWNHHLRGAEEMVRSRKLQRNKVQDGSAPWLKYFDTACTTFGILGATLAPASSHSSLRLPLLDPAFLQTLRHSENQTWVGCPAELLYFLSTINSLRSLSATAPERIQVIPELCHRLLDFCPATWAEDFPDRQHHESRSHLAHAYKAAVEIYTSHIIGASPGQHYLSQPFIDAALRPAILHMLAISPEDFHIKSLVWPAFVIGAQSDSRELRQMVREVFQRIWVSSCCYNSKNAVGILEAIWARSSHEPWLEFVWQLEENWLFV